MKVKVIGIGNVLASDDAIGIYVARELQKVKLPENIEVIAAESPGPSMMELIAGAEKVILIDAARGAGSPGKVHRLLLDDLQAGRCRLSSLHEINLLDIFRIGQITQPNTFPKELVILGIEVADTTRYKQCLSEAVRDAIPSVISAVLTEISSGCAAI